MADPTVKVVIEVDDTNARKEITNLGNALAKLRTSAKNISRDLKEGAREATRELEKQARVTKRTADNTKELDSAANKTAGSIRKLTSSASSFLRTTLSGISGVSQLAKQLVQQAQAAGLSSSQIRSVAQATGAFTREQVALIGRSAQLSSAVNGLNKALARGTINGRQYAQALSSISSRFSDVTTSTTRAQASQERLNRTQQQNQGVLGGLIGSYVRLRIAMDAVRQVAQAVSRAIEFAEQGAQIQQTAISFDNFANNIAGLPDLLDDLTAAADGTVSQFQLMTSTLTLTAGVAPDVARTLAEASPQLLEIARAAAIINPALGDTQVLFDRLALGIKRSSSRILDDLGIIVKLGEANERFAASIGKAVKELTAEERQIALLNETLRAGQNLINQAGDSAENTIDPFLRLRANTEELKNELQELAADGIRPIIVELDRLVAALSRGVAALGEEGRGRGQLDALGDAATDINNTVDAIERLQQASAIGRRASGAATGFIESLVRAVSLPALAGDLALGESITRRVLEDLESRGITPTPFGRGFAESAEAEQREIISEIIRDPEALRQEPELAALISLSRENIDFEGLSIEEIEDLLVENIGFGEDGELTEVVVNLAVLTQLEDIEARRLKDLVELDPGIVRGIERATGATREATDEQKEYIEQLREAEEATRDFAISAVESSAKVDEFGKLILETADELDLTEDEVLDLALSLGILDEETFQNAQTLIEFNNLLAELAPALAAGGEEAEEAKRQLADFLADLPEDGQIRITIQAQLEGVSQDFVSEQVDLFTQLAEEQAKLDELTEVTRVPAAQVVATLQARIDADLTDDEVRELEDRLKEDIPDAERLAIEARLDLDLTDDEVRQFKRRIADIRESGAAFVDFIAGTTKQIEAQEEAVRELSDAIAENFLRSIFEATVAQKGWNEETLQFGLALGVINPDIEDQIRGAIQLGEAFDELVGLLDERGITLGSKAAAEAFAALDLGKTAEEALAAAQAFVRLQSGAKNAAKEAKNLRDQSLVEIEGVIPPSLREPIEDDRPTFLNLALPEEFKDDVEEVEEFVEDVTDEEIIIPLKISPDFIDELNEILSIIEQLSIPGSTVGGGNVGGGIALSQFGNALQPGQASVVGEVRPELIVPQVPVDVLSRVPAGFNNAISGAGARAAVPQQNITNITSNRTTQISNATTNALNIDVPNPTEAIQVVRDIQGGVFIA